MERSDSRIGINCAILHRGISGTASVTRQIAAALRSQPNLDVVDLFPAKPKSSRRLVNAYRAGKWDLWDAARTTHLDVLVSPCNTGSAPRRLPHILVMQDTMVLDHPEHFDPGYARYARLMFGLSVRRATQIVTASEHAAAAIRRRWPSAPLPRVIGWPAPAGSSPTARVLGPGPHTVLMVGVTEPHKNHVGGIEAVRLARLLTGADINLEIVGPPGHAESRVRELMQVVDPLGQWARRLPALTEDQLGEAYGRAWALLQPSLAEGFGLPLLEAAANGLPVVHTGRASMPEVCPDGDAGGTDPLLLARRLRSLLDPGFYATASEASLHAGRMRTRERFAKEWTALVEEVSA